MKRLEENRDEQIDKLVEEQKTIKTYKDNFLNSLENLIYMRQMMHTQE